VSRTLADWLRDAYADPAAGCPPPEAFLGEEQAAMTAEQRQALAAHAERCPACRAERELARAFDEGAAGASAEDVEWVVARLRGEDAARQRPAAAAVQPATAARVGSTGTGDEKGAGGMQPRGRLVPLRRRAAAPAWTRLAAAAALVVAAGLTLFAVYDRPPALPEPPHGGVVRGGEVEVEAPLGDVAEPPRELRWRPVDGAIGYRVRLLAVDETPLWDDRVAAPPAVIPPSAVARLHRAVSYDWVVEAMAPDGTVLARSAPARFRIRELSEPAAGEGPR
jgi:hypothetical protein